MSEVNGKPHSAVPTDHRVDVLDVQHAWQQMRCRCFNLLPDEVMGSGSWDCTVCRSYIRVEIIGSFKINTFGVAVLTNVSRVESVLYGYFAGESIVTEIYNCRPGR